MEIAQGFATHGTVKAAEFLTMDANTKTESIPVENRAEHLIEFGAGESHGQPVR